VIRDEKRVRIGSGPENHSARNTAIFAITYSCNPEFEWASVTLPYLPNIIPHKGTFCGVEETARRTYPEACR
jgi:hypothetical protein